MLIAPSLYLYFFFLQQKRGVEKRIILPIKREKRQELPQEPPKVEKIEEEIKKENYSRFSHKVPLNKRAITIPVDIHSAVGYLLNVGDKVDIIAIFSDKEAKTIIQAAEILAIETEYEESKEAKPFANVTLGVSPREAEILAAATHAASRILLTLRNPQTKTYFPPTKVYKKKRVSKKEIKKEEITPRPIPKITPIPTPTYCEVEVYRGIQKTNIIVPSEGLKSSFKK
jgi:Flp pilus assembly protein CpaB